MRPTLIFSLLALVLLGLVVYSGMRQPPAEPLPTPTTASIVSITDAPTLTPTYAPGREPMKLPADYRDNFILYAIVDHSDAVTRKIFISPAAVEAVRAGGDLPERTQIVVEAYDAARDAKGNPLTDADGHLVAGAFQPEVHVAELRSEWQIEDLASDAPLGGWNFDAFDFNSGMPNHAVRFDCFSCHDNAFSSNFIFTRSMLTNYADTGITQYLDCPTPARVPCTR